MMTSQPLSPIPERPTARVLLLDALGRILLMKGRLPGNPERDAAWFTVGGGVEPGESWLDAAAREILEETGITEFELGPIVWARSGVLNIPDPRLFQERYIVARCAVCEPHRGGWEALEHELIDEMRWWTLADLRATSEAVFPGGLAERLPEILAGRYPAEPQLIPWG